ISNCSMPPEVDEITRFEDDGATELPSPTMSSKPGDGGIVFTQVASLHGKSHRLIFDRKRNIFQFMLNDDVRVKITYRVDELLAVKKQSAKIKKGILQPLEIKKDTASTLFFYFVFRKNKHKWRLLEVPVVFSSSMERDYWERVCQMTLKALDHRPRSILVYINPFGGKGTAKSIYLKYVEPLFQLADINAQVIYTQHANHAKEHVEGMNEYDWKTIDGIVSVGGDGLFNECLSGAINRTQTEVSVDVDDRRSILKSPRIPFGIIGAGSANSIVMTVHDTDDYATSAVHIAIGSRCRVDACTVHEKKGLVRVSADAISYGWLGDVLRDSERYRWLGPLRYQWSAIRTTIRNPTYRGTVSFSLSSNETNCPVDKLPSCLTPCALCQQTDVNSEMVGISRAEHQFHVHTDFAHIICCVIPCVTPFTPLGLAPFTGLGDGSLDLALLPRLSRFANLNFMRRAAQYGGKGLYEMDPSLNCYRVSSWSYCPDKSLIDRGVWNVDGEIVEQPAERLFFHLHPRLISFFGRDDAVITPTKRSILKKMKRKSSIVYR
ncbi:cerk-1, partial [Pristionchus pacificus]